MTPLHVSRRQLFAALALATALVSPAPVRPEAGAKIDPWISTRLEVAPQELVPVVVELAERADLSGISGTKAQKGAEVYRRLSAAAERAQGPLLARLAELGVPYRSFWIANVVALEADDALVAELAARPDVARVAGDSPVRVPDTLQPQDEITPSAPTAIEWNVLKVNADDVWALGYTGQGAVLGGQDTGYQWDHPALQAKYRGWNGGAADHNHNWHDAIRTDIGVPGSNSCGRDLVIPCDDHGHGTHTMGTMVGDDGGSNQIGVAPGARWIGCRNMDEGDGIPSTYIECFQWFLAPTDLAGGNADPALAPDAINNSWGCPTSEGCNTGNFATMQAVVESLRAAGIVVVVSAGNGGSSCGSVNAPAAIFDASFSVGNTDSSDAIAGSSSRGPVTVDGSNRPKPDISAPGTNIRSSIPGSTYQGGWSGTSMAGPHVAGAVALLISAHSKLRGNVDLIERLLEETSLERTTSQGCGGDTPTQVPNNTYGWGRLNVLAAVQSVVLLDDFESSDLAEWDLICPPNCEP